MKNKVLILIVLLSLIVTVRIYPEEDVWKTIISFVERGLEGVEMTDQAISDLEGKINELTYINEEQSKLIEEARDLIASLRQDISDARYAVEIALDRTYDAESYTLFFIAETERQISELQKTQQSYKRAWIGASILSLGWTSSGVWTTHTIRDGRFDPWSVSPAIFSTLVYIGGRLFKTW